MRIYAHVCGLVCALFLNAAPALAEDRALVMGVNDYKDPAVADLTGPALDVKHMQSLLMTDLGFAGSQIKVLSGSEATRSGIVEAIQKWLIDGTKPGDRIFMYFSGHGAKVQIPNSDGSVRLTSGLVPYDASSTVAETTTRAGGLLLGSQLGAMVKKMKGREVTIVVDACYSGSLTRGANRRVPPPGIRSITPNGPATLDPADITDALVAESKTVGRLLDFNARGGEVIDGVAVWSAATIAQLSFDSADGGIFTNAFIGGIHDRKASPPSDGKVTASNLLSHVRDVTGQFCSSFEGCTLGFTPELLAPDSYRASVIAPYLPPAPSEVDVALEEPEVIEMPNASEAPPVGEPEEVETPNVSAPPPAQDPNPIATPDLSEPPGLEEPTAPVFDGAEPSTTDAHDLVDLAEGVLSHTNDFALTATIIPSPQIKLGDAVKFRIVSAESGQLLVLDTGPDGKLRRIYPNEYSEAAGRLGSINAAAELTIPDESYPFVFTATDAGQGTLMVLVAEPGTDFAPILTSPDFAVNTNADRALIAVATELQEPILVPDPDVNNRARRWAFVTVPYFIGE